MKLLQDIKTKHDEYKQKRLEKKVDKFLEESKGKDVEAFRKDLLEFMKQHIMDNILFGI